MRIFIVVSPAITSPSLIPSSGIAGATRRLDVVARCLLQALCTANGPRDDTVFAAVLKGPPNPPLSIILRGEDLGSARNEVQAVGVIKKCMEGLIGERMRAGLAELVDHLLSTCNTRCKLVLSEKGLDVDCVRLSPNVIVVLGSNVDLEPEEIEELRKRCFVDVSIGPKSYLASHCIAYMNWLLDLSERITTNAL